MFVLVIPGDLGLDGYEHADHVGAVEVADRMIDDPPVIFRFHTRRSEHGTAAAVMDLLHGHMSQADWLPSEGFFLSPPPSTYYTLVEALTTSDSPDAHDDKPLLARSPREDPLVRCMRLLSDVVRTTTLASLRMQEHPTIERSLPIHVRYTAPGLITTYQGENGDPIHTYAVTGDWEGPHLDELAESTAPLLSPAEPVDMSSFRHWMMALRAGHPFVTWQEHWLEAQKSFIFDGDYSQAVVFANTSCEVFLDATLTLLYWENGDSAETVAPYFAEGGLLSRVTRRFSGLLHGNGWQTSSEGPIRDWYVDTYRLRHRVIHGGYRPTYEEARSALDACRQLREFVQQRLIVARSRFPKNFVFWFGEDHIEQNGWMTGKVRAARDQMAATPYGRQDELEDALQYRQQIVALTRP